MRPSLPPGSTAMPCCASSADIVAMSASCGTLRSVSALVGQQAGRHQRQGGVLGAADGDLAGERPAAADADAIHDLSLLYSPRQRDAALAHVFAGLVGVAGLAGSLPCRNRNWQMPSLA